LAEERFRYVGLEHFLLIDHVEGEADSLIRCYGRLKSLMEINFFRVELKTFHVAGRNFGQALDDGLTRQVGGRIFQREFLVKGFADVGQSVKLAFFFKRHIEVVPISLLDVSDIEQTIVELFVVAECHGWEWDLEVRLADFLKYFQQASSPLRCASVFDRKSQ
jgi:hypothetical protein